MTSSQPLRRSAFYGGTFDPFHNGHMAVAQALLEQFRLDEFTFIPAFQAPHKKRSRPTSPYDRFTMLCLATQDHPRMGVSKMEVEMPDRPFSVETLERLNAEYPNDEIFFVMGADSWMEITAWREWEKVLTMANHIVVTRPGIDMGLSHVTDDIRKRVVDLRAGKPKGAEVAAGAIFFSDAVLVDVSATGIRAKIRVQDPSWHRDVPVEVAKYIEKYQIYK